MLIGCDWHMWIMCPFQGIRCSDSPDLSYMPNLGTYGVELLIQTTTEICGSFHSYFHRRSRSSWWAGNKTRCLWIAAYQSERLPWVILKICYLCSSWKCTVDKMFLVNYFSFLQCLIWFILLPQTGLCPYCSLETIFCKVADCPLPSLFHWPVCCSSLPSFY